jgi:hypothetical protein
MPCSRPLAFACIALSLMLASACTKPAPQALAAAQDAPTTQTSARPHPDKKPPSEMDGSASSLDSNRFIRSSDLERYSYVMAKASIACKDAERALDCSMGNPNNDDVFEASLYQQACGDGGVFAGVIADSNAVLYDRYPPKAGAWPASLARGQFLCVLADAGSAGEAYLYYVVVVPTESVADCAGSDLCKAFGNRAVTWHVPHSSLACRSRGPGMFEGACAMGWIDAGKIEVFSMGLIPEPDYRGAPRAPEL